MENSQEQCCRGAGVVFPILLILIGGALLAEKFGYIGEGQIWRLWPLALIALGVHMLFNPREGRS
ncbi:MAG: hypothetical protein HY822_13685 [Acidobacteria bacterium]|nr:hypothetical protein [Acidobacteriota bacterium]